MVADTSFCFFADKNNIAEVPVQVADVLAARVFESHTILAIITFLIRISN